MGECAEECSPVKASLREATAIWWKVGFLSFGGPAGQIALMHKLVVDEKRWLSERKFLHALNFCMLLPGPEAMQLATYCGWLLHGVRGGLIAGILFVLPGFLVLLGLSIAYVTFGDVPAIEGLLFGLKAAVVAIVFAALRKVSKKALKGKLSLVIAIAAFIALFLLKIPFPIVILVAAIIGYLFKSQFADGVDDEAVAEPIENPVRHVMVVLVAALIFWLAPIIGLSYWLGSSHLFVEEALFFSKTAVVTFGGAYAVLAYVSQQAVELFGWLKPDEMITGLGLAETTPGPLILVLVFVGFLGAFRESVLLDPIMSGILGATITTWVTFVPCFIWIFLGAPFIEALRSNQNLSAAFAAITAAVVGVIANLSLWFAVHVLFDMVDTKHIGLLSLLWPRWESLDGLALAIVLISTVLIWRGFGVFTVLLLAIGLGIGNLLLG